MERPGCQTSVAPETLKGLSIFKKSEKINLHTENTNFITLDFPFQFSPEPILGGMETFSQFQQAKLDASPSIFSFFEPLDHSFGTDHHVHRTCTSWRHVPPLPSWRTSSWRNFGGAAWRFWRFWSSSHSYGSYWKCLFVQGFYKRSPQKSSVKDLKVRFLFKLSTRDLWASSLFSSPCLCTRSLQEVSWQDLCASSLQRSLGKVS